MPNNFGFSFFLIMTFLTSDTALLQKNLEFTAQKEYLVSARQLNSNRDHKGKLSGQF